MEAPLCKICSTRHWGREPHAGMTSKPVALAAAKRAVASPDKLDAVITGRLPAIEKPKGKRKPSTSKASPAPAAAPTGRRPGYHAEYMRKKRAAVAKP